MWSEPIKEFESISESSPISRNSDKNDHPEDKAILVKTPIPRNEVGDFLCENIGLIISNNNNNNNQSKKFITKHSPYKP